MAVYKEAPRDESLSYDAVPKHPDKEVLRDEYGKQYATVTWITEGDTTVENVPPEPPDHDDTAIEHCESCDLLIVGKGVGVRCDTCGANVLPES